MYELLIFFICLLKKVIVAKIKSRHVKDCLAWKVVFGCRHAIENMPKTIWACVEATCAIACSIGTAYIPVSVIQQIPSINRDH